MTNPTPPASPPATVTAYPDGPLVVRGPVELVDESGRPLERRRRTVALCRCGRTSIAPFCDGSHKAGSRVRPATAAPVREVRRTTEEEER